VILWSKSAGFIIIVFIINDPFGLRVRYLSRGTH
jgi:hypothetical protein